MLPKNHPIPSAQLPEYLIIQLDNEAELIALEDNDQELVRFECAFKAGRWYESRQMVARATAKMVREGTKDKTSLQIAEFLEYHGASVGFEDGFDHVIASLSCLSKHFSALLPLLHELLTDPAFRQEDLLEWAARSKQKLKINMEKAESQTFRIFTERLFGKGHPYGYNSFPEDYDDLDPKLLKAHFEKCYKLDKALYSLVGKFDAKDLEMVKSLFGGQVATPENVSDDVLHLQAIPERTADLPKDTTQCSIRIGRKIDVTSPVEHASLHVLNCLLGGYFGSRLMTNLREEKGITYGIQSYVDKYVQAGVLHISAEVNREKAEEAIMEIKNELDILRKEPVNEEELEMVRNYMRGNALQNVDGVFSSGEMIRDFILSGEPPVETSDIHLSVINQITPEELRQLAEKYWKWEDLIVVVYPPINQ